MASPYTFSTQPTGCIPRLRTARATFTSAPTSSLQPTRCGSRCARDRCNETWTRRPTERGHARPATPVRAARTLPVRYTSSKTRRWKHRLRSAPEATVLRSLGSTLRIALGLCIAAGLFACQTDVYDPQTDPATLPLAIPARNVFPQVADAMQLHCGTLDCHGQIGRNMRLYGQFGMRLNPADDPLGQVTTPAEYDACYESIVGLEPEIMSQVVLL